jgi:hypothetical protein
MWDDHQPFISRFGVGGYQSDSDNIVGVSLMITGVKSPRGTLPRGTYRASLHNIQSFARIRYNIRSMFMEKG